MKKMKNLSVFLLTATVLLSSTACGDSNSTQSSSSGDNGGTSTGATVKIDQDIYNALSADYQFDTEYVKKNKTKFSGTLYMASAYGNEMKIVWCYNYSLSKMDYWDIEKAALDEVNNGTILYCPITCIPISREDGGDGRHTDAAGGKAQGSELAAFIETNIYS